MEVAVAFACSRHRGTRTTTHSSQQVAYSTWLVSEREPPPNPRPPHPPVCTVLPLPVLYCARWAREPPSRRSVRVLLRVELPGMQMARCASSSLMKVEIRFSGPAVPACPNHGRDGTRPSSDTSPATAVAVGVASAPDRRRADEGCVVDGLRRLRGMHSIMQKAFTVGHQAVAAAGDEIATLSACH